MTATPPSFDVGEELSNFGASSKQIRYLDAPRLDPRDELVYGDLISHSSQGIPAPISAVVESDGRPFIYAVRQADVAIGPQRRTKALISKISRTLACRGAGAYLALVEPGRLTIYPCALGNTNKSAILTSLDVDAPSFIQSLLHADKFDEDLADPRLKDVLSVETKSAHKILLSTINSVAQKLTKGIISTIGEDNCADIVLALVGRAIFTRFLVDRAIVAGPTFPHCNGEPRSCFDSAANAAATCAWLDATFNGDFLHIDAPGGYGRFFAQIEQADKDFFHTLGSLLYPADARGQLRLPFWSQIDFAHIPVGLLSEVYEDYVHRHQGEEADATSIHYTPRHIAELIIDQAFSALKTSKPHEAKLLDPASGAGVFLTIGFKRLYLELWKHRLEQGECRPGTAEIRKILYSQVRGYDINPAALTLSALSLYLTAIELDPAPLPPERLRFDKNLLGTVLFDVRSEGDVELGALGGDIPRERQFDIVFGNPPWTSLPGVTGETLARSAEELARKALAERGAKIDDPAFADLLPYKNPDNVPDLPFLLRSMEWAKHGGVIAYALHARLLFKTSPVALRARDLIFRAIRVTGIINCAALRQSSQVWPGVSPHFCILFAYNEAASSFDAFNYYSPYVDSVYGGRIRLDPRQITPVRARALEAQPFLLKALFRGDVLDAPIIERLHSLLLSPDNHEPAPALPLGEYLDSKGVERGQGYIVGSKSQEPTHLHSLRAKHLTAHTPIDFVINDDEFPSFDTPRIHRNMPAERFAGPLVLMRVAPAAIEDARVAYIYPKMGHLIFSATFVGLSFAKASTPDKQMEAVYLAALLNSRLFKYWALLTSAKFGVERDAWNDEDIYSLPVKPLESLPSLCIEKLQNISREISLGAAPDINLIEEFVASVYDLSDEEVCIIKDTLSVCLPMGFSKKNAQRRPTKNEVNDFVSVVAEIARPVASLMGCEMEFRPRHDLNTLLSPWWYLEVAPAGQEFFLPDLPEIRELADKEGCSQVFLHSGQMTGLRVGLRAQYRYWTSSRARLLADEILRQLWGWE